MDQREPGSDERVDTRHSPFYEWLDNATIRQLVHNILERSVGERLVLIKGVVPELVTSMGVEEFDAFLTELQIKAHRFQEASDHPGEGRALRTTPGERLGGPTPAGHEHLPIARDPDRLGGRAAERAVERELWAGDANMSGCEREESDGARE